MWRVFDKGKTIGRMGSEDGVITADMEYADQARITLEQGGVTAPWSITMGIYGLMAHTEFFATEAQAQAHMQQVMRHIEGILALCEVPDAERDDPWQARLNAAIDALVNGLENGGGVAA